MNYRKYLFLDRDGTLIQESSDYQIDSIEKFSLLPDVISSLLSLQRAGYLFVLITNQDGLGSDSYPQAKFDAIQNLLLNILASQGIQFESVLICPHFEKDRCFCRKPQLGLVQKYLSMPELDRNQSFVIGDRVTDLKLAENMGISGIQIGGHDPELGTALNWQAITRQLLSRSRKGSLVRKTKETHIQVQVSLEGDPTLEISTGIGFFDHMLEQLSHHGAFGARIQVRGDLQIDDHHTIEDTGLALGSALRQALGDKVGIERFGFYLPMDDASTQVALDLSGRSYFRFEGQLARNTIGGMSTEMIPHFFKSLSDSLGANLHIRVTGENTHHQIESIFKAVGRSLKAAIQFSAPRSTEANLSSLDSSTRQVPSTKGML